MADDVAAPLPQLGELDTDALFAGAKAGAAGTAAPASSVRRLTVGRADDPSERLADRMADSAVSQLRRSESGGARRSIRRFRNMLMSADDFNKTVPSVAGWVSGKDPSQRGELAKLVAEYYKLVPGTKGQALQATDLDKALSLLQGMKTIAQSYFDDGGLKKDAKQTDGFKAFMKKVEDVEKQVQDRRLEKGKDPDVKPNEAAQKFKKHDPADNVTLFTKVGMLLGTQLEEDGESVEYSVELMIPMPPYQVGGSLAIEGEKDDGKYKAKAQVTLKGGGKIPKFAEITASLGGYLEAQSGDPKLTGDLLGYALYRRMAESSVVPAEAQYYLFGTAGRDGKQSSEENMAYIEKMAFGEDADEDTYAESGGVVEIEAEGKVPGTGVKGSASVGATVGSRTDKKSLEMNKMKAGEAKGKQSGLVSAVTMGARGAEKTTGRTIGGFDVGLSFTKPVEIEGEYSVRWIKEGEGITAVDTHEMGVTLTIPEDAAEKVKPAIEALTHYIETKQEVAEAQTKKEKSNVFVTKQLDLLKEKASDQVTDIAKDAIGSDKGMKKIGKKLGFKDEEGLAVGLSIDFTSGAIDVSLIETETKSIDVAGLKAEMKKTSKKSANLRKGKEDDAGGAGS